MIEADQLSKYYGDFAAIEGVSFSIAEGEIVGLMGLNGAGKSTILKVLGSFLIPSTGEAKIDGVSTEKHPMKVRKKIGFLPDTPPLYDEMSTVKYLQFVARLNLVPEAEVRHNVDKVMEETGLKDRAQTALGALSHGYRQRVGIAHALVHQPKVLILDEPINGLDPVQIIGMRDLILSLKGQYTVILSSHILSEMTKTCDRILILDEGRLIAEGTEEELLRSSQNRMELNCQVRQCNTAIQEKLKSLEGVRSVEVSNHVDHVNIHLDLIDDCRPQIARELLSCELLGMTKKEEGLESVFVNMIQNPRGENQ